MKKHSILIGRRITSISLEDVFWTSLQEIARCGQVTRSDLIASLDAERGDSNLSSTIRVFILDYYRAMAAENLRQAVLEWANGKSNDLTILREVREVRDQPAAVRLAAIRQTEGE